ncbi:Pvc16 family protein [Sphingomonas sp. PAMC 26605]|uniref:Pvc16 family protein n=1 Tax=Sphingomonas sp. PAMC 26605 TaxID=1112214 RepID=UPI00026CCA3C|nr:Pvc16 family protein [Sphingomonas sp. PAMC 26605]
MSAAAIFDTTLALKRRIEAGLAPGETVYVGQPVRAELGESSVALFLFSAEPNRDLRNTVRTALPTGLGPQTAPLGEERAIPLDLRYLVAAFRKTGAAPGADPEELLRLGEVIQALENDPMLTEAEAAGQLVRITLEPAPIDELNRIWAVFPEESYQTSLVYLASPVWVSAGLPTVGPPVLSREQRTGLSAEPPRVFADAAS